MNNGLAGQLPEQLSTSLHLDAAYRAAQIFEWIQRGVFSFHDMTNLPKPLRSSLAEQFPSIIESTVEKQQLDPHDGSLKLTLRLFDGAVVETVMLNDGKDRNTACVSSQAGCAMGCRFCRTGSLGLKRSLSASEIVEQLILLKSLGHDITHVVFMGMGEPLANLEEVRRSIAVFHHPKGHGIGHRRITISTCGLPQGIRSLAESGPPVRLAVSLVAPENTLRSSLMPINTAFPLESLKPALAEYQQKTRRRITLEYVLMKGENDRIEDVERLAAFCSGLQVLVNLIPWNPAADLPFKQPSRREAEAFARRLEHAGLRVSKRLRKGQSINGACGQLAGE